MQKAEIKKINPKHLFELFMFKVLDDYSFCDRVSRKKLEDVELFNLIAGESTNLHCVFIILNVSLSQFKKPGQRHIGWTAGDA